MHWVGKENSSQSQVFQPLGLGEWAGQRSLQFDPFAAGPQGSFFATAV